MRILVISDSHGRSGRIEEAIEAQPQAKYVFFLGDRLQDIDYLPELYPDRIFYSVPGNCDFSVFEPTTKTVTLGGKKILYTHGHEFSVKSGISRLRSYAKNAGADIALYGHTHLPQTLYEDETYIINPGSLGRGQEFCSYAVVDIETGGIMPVIIKI